MPLLLHQPNPISPLPAGSSSSTSASSKKQSRRAFSFSSAAVTNTGEAVPSPHGGYGSMSQQAEQARASFLVLTHGTLCHLGL